MPNTSPAQPASRSKPGDGAGRLIRRDQKQCRRHAPQPSPAAGEGEIGSAPCCSLSRGGRGLGRGPPSRPNASTMPAGNHRRRPAPPHQSQRHNLLADLEVQPLVRLPYGGGDPTGGDVCAHHRHVAQRQQAPVGKRHGVAADLSAELRGAKHRRPNALLRGLQPPRQLPGGDALGDGPAKMAAEIAQAPGLPFRRCTPPRHPKTPPRRCPHGSAVAASAANARPEATDARGPARSPRTAPPPAGRPAPRARPSTARPAPSSPQFLQYWRKALSSCAQRPSPSKVSSRAPIASAAVCTTWPSATTASLVVAPPMSRLSTVPWSCRDKATAPLPCAASRASRWWPAAAATSRPRSSARLAPMAAAFLLAAALPVRMSAPLSTSRERMPALSYASRTSLATASASIAPSAAYGVRVTGDLCTSSRSTTSYRSDSTRRRRYSSDSVRCEVAEPTSMPRSAAARACPRPALAGRPNPASSSARARARPRARPSRGRRAPASAAGQASRRS